MSREYLYEIPFRPNYEKYAAACWFASTAATAGVSMYSGLPHSLLLGLGLVQGTMTSIRAIQAGIHHSRLKKFTVDKKLFINEKQLAKKEKDDGIYLGEAFAWKQEQAQLAFDISKRDLTDILPSTKGSNGEEAGAVWINGLGEKKPLYLPLELAKGHVFILGTTGSGKTRLLEGITTQDVNRGETVIVIDPKGDKELADNLRQACIARGEEYRFLYFNPAFPEKSIRWDPMYTFSRKTELASRVASLIPSEGQGDAFSAFCFMALNNVVQGLIMLKKRVTLMEIRPYLETTPEGLALRCAEDYFSVVAPQWREDLEGHLKRAKNQEKRFLALKKYYYDKVRDIKANADLEGLLTMGEHDRTHYQKMITSLLPIMTQLTSSELGPMLSPSYDDTEDDGMPIVNSASVIEKKSVVYLGLDSLSDNTVSGAIGSIILSDLAAVAGERYNYGDELHRVNITVDEAAEVLSDRLIQLLNKTRGAKYQLRLATQTIADITDRLGSVHKMNMTLGNTNNTIALRTKDPDSQEYILSGVPKTMLKHIMHTTSSNSSGNNLQHSGGSGERLMEVEAPLMAPELLGNLPDLTFVARFAQGQLFSGKVPILQRTN